MDGKKEMRDTGAMFPVLLSIALILFALPQAQAMEVPYVKIICDGDAKEFHLTVESEEAGTFEEIERKYHADGDDRIDILTDTDWKTREYTCAPLQIRAEIRIGLSRGTLSGYVSLWDKTKEIFSGTPLYNELWDYQYSIFLVGIHYKDEQWIFRQCKKCEKTWDRVCLEEKTGISVPHGNLEDQYGSIYDRICGNLREQRSRIQPGGSL